MIPKLNLFRTVIVVLLMCLLIWDIMLWFSCHARSFEHRNTLLTVALLWFVSLLFPQKTDDDWAANF